jgi:signal transduction histidine kinase
MCVIARTATMPLVRGQGLQLVVSIVLPIASLRTRLLLVVATAIAPFLVYAALTTSQEKTVAGMNLRTQSLGRARAIGQRVDAELATIDMLLDSAAYRVRRAGAPSLDAGSTSSLRSQIAAALSIAVIDTSGGRLASLFGDPARIDAIPLNRRSALATLAMGNARAASGVLQESFVDEGRGRNSADSIAMIIVRPMARVNGGCECLADRPGAVVAVLSDRALQQLLGADSLPDGAVVTFTGSSGSQLGRLSTPERWIDRDVRDSNTFGGILEREGALDMQGPDGLKRAMGFAALKQFPWRVYFGVPLATVSAASDGRMRDTGLLSLLALVIAAVGSVIAARRITVPLQTLTADAKRMMGGGTQHRTEMAAQPGDIGELGLAMNALATEYDAKRKVLQEELRLSSQVFDESPIAMWVSDATTMGTGSGRIQHANAAAGRLFGVAAASLIGQRDLELFASDSSEAIAPPHATRAERVRVRRARAMLRTKLGEKDCSLWVVEVLHALRPVRVVCAMDAEAASESEPVHRAPTVAAVPTVSKVIPPANTDNIVAFASRVADDLSEVLSGVSGFTQLAVDSRDDAEMRAIALERIAELSQHGGHLAEQLRAVGQHESLSLTQIDANEVMSAAAAALASSLGQHVVIESRYDATPATVMADTAQLHRMVSALIENANEAMPAGGTLTLATALAEVAADSKVTHAVGAGHYVVLSVTDTGIGMSDDVQRQMFEPYFTTKRTRSGTGLGLAALAGMAQQHGWAITVDSAPEVGTSVSLYMPLVTYSAAAMLLDDDDQISLVTAPARIA